MCVRLNCLTWVQTHISLEFSHCTAVINHKHTCVSLSPAQVSLALFVLLCVSDWWILGALYAGWLYLDRDTPSSGGRRSQWVRSWRVWTYFRDYFPITVSLYEHLFMIFFKKISPPLAYFSNHQKLGIIWLAPPPSGQSHFA